MNTQLTALLRGTEQVVHKEDLAERLEGGKPLRVKVGFDPTAPDLHLGHTVLMHKMRQFQDLGHQVIFLVGDFTGRIGDPSGRNATRPILTAQELQDNQKTYLEQAFKILDREKTEVRFNSEWMDQMTPDDLVRLASEHTVARMLERDDFAKRYGENQPISIHEFLYPLIQGYDSVMLEADVELGGTDQTFNLLVGRELQKRRGQPPQIVMTLPLLEGTDGVRKMSKSYDNAIGIQENPEQMFGKLMSLSDPMMWRYFDLLSLRPETELEDLRQRIENGGNPRDAKLELARELVARFHGEQAAEQAQEDFTARFRDHQLPEDMEEIALTAAEALLLPNALQQAGLCSSTSDARRMIEAGAVRMDGEKVDDLKCELPFDNPVVLQVGRRRVARVHLTKH
ncbi:MAG: tyrosine--tRNA ligase [Gammaproteobacteria bacterium]|nr:tyrosine--tRNA ligase [Gammaproteobacteria bacterium]